MSDDSNIHIRIMEKFYCIKCSGTFDFDEIKIREGMTLCRVCNDEFLELIDYWLKNNKICMRCQGDCTHG